MFITIVLLLLGVVLLLFNVGIISLNFSIVFSSIIPFLLLIWGAVGLVRSITKKNKAQSLLLHMFLVVYGGLIVLHAFGYISFGYGDWWKLWPLIILSYALDKLFYGKEKKQKSGLQLDVKSKQLDKMYSFVGSVVMKNANWPLKSKVYKHFIGDCYFDISQAYIPEETVHLQIACTIGEVVVKLPKELPVKIDAHVKVGEATLLDQNQSGMSAHLSYESITYKEAVQKIHLDVSVSVGEVLIQWV